MTSYTLMQQAGPQAEARRARNARSIGMTTSWVRPRNVGVVVASCGVEALGDYIAERYQVGHKQYAGHRYEWRTERGNTWRAWDHISDPGTRGRMWRAVVKLRNGISEHEIFIEAWRS